MDNGEFATLVGRTAFLLTKEELPPNEWKEAIEGVDLIRAEKTTFELRLFFWEWREYRALYGEIHGYDGPKEEPDSPL